MPHYTHHIKRADYFWTRLIRDFVPTLKTQRKWQKEVQNLEVGKTALIFDPQLQRSYAEPISLCTPRLHQNVKIPWWILDWNSQQHLSKGLHLTILPDIAHKLFTHTSLRTQIQQTAPHRQNVCRERRSSDACLFLVPGVGCGAM